MKKFLAFAFHHLCDRNTGGTAYDLRDFLSAHACAQKLRTALVFNLILLFSLFEFFFKLRKDGVLQLRQAFVLGFTPAGFHFLTHAVNFVTDVLFTERFALFSLPDLFEVGVLARQRLDLRFDCGEALLTCLIRFLLHRLTFNL